VRVARCHGEKPAAREGIEQANDPRQAGLGVGQNDGRAWVEEGVLRVDHQQRRLTEVG
jgi:hypothetical protein